MALASVPSPDVSVLPRPRVDGVPLRRLAAGVGGRASGGSVTVSGVSLATVRVRPGDLFVAVPGRTHHGARFAAQALAAGAVAVLTDAAGSREVAHLDCPVVEVGDPRAAAGPAAALVYGDPSRSIRLLGVTGTSGKTTTTFLIRTGLTAAARNSGLIGTVATYVGADVLRTGFTTPEAPDLQALLAVMRERGLTDVGLEVSSQGLALGRVGGCTFAAAGFTNLSQDHLDFHPDLDAYFEAKATLFTGGSGTSLTGPALVVTDDAAGRRLAARLGSRASTISTTGLPAAWRATDIEIAPDGTAHFWLHPPAAAPLPAGSAIPGRFNVANVVLAVAMLDAVGVPPATSVPAVAVATVPGRMEPVGLPAGPGPLVVVDYSHKPDAVVSALAALRPLTSGRLIIVLGCGGDRDRGKRPVMGEAAARHADLLVITDDNPRSEDPAAIRAAMLAGALAVPAADRGEVVECGSRAAAIALALVDTAAGDTVLIAGKGHETGQEIAGETRAFDDREVARAALRERWPQ